MARASSRRPGLLLALALVAWSATPAGAEAPDGGFLSVEAFRSDSHAIRLAAVDTGEKCRAMPVPSPAGPDGLRLRIACGAAASGDPDWNALPPLEFAVERSAAPGESGTLLLDAGGRTYRVKAAYFRLSDRTPTRLPACSALGPQRRAMAATQGSGRRMCDPNR